MKKKIKIGLDFDGVVAYNPFRVVRAPVVLLKKMIFGIRDTKFIIPHTPAQRWIWALMHETSYFLAPGIDVIRMMKKSGRFEFHLITARYNFLQTGLYRFLRRYEIESLFETITMNVQNEQPHMYKKRVVQEKNLDYFIEDNLDIVHALSEKVPTRIYWIYNFFDRTNTYSHKYPYLQKALEAILEERKKYT